MKRITILILIVLFLVAGCETKRYEGQGETQKSEAKFSEQQQARLLKAHPQPVMNYSLERANLTDRLERFNDPNKVSYIYLLSDTGQIYAFLPIKGKVSSVNSKMSTGEQIVDDPFYWNNDGGGQVVESPQEDGSYGTNGDAIFFFSADGTYFEWNGKYLLADRPFQLSEQPLLIYNASEE